MALSDENHVARFVGDRIRFHRQRRGWTQVDLATRAHHPKSHGMISMAERGDRTLQLDTFFDLAEALDAPVADFFPAQKAMVHAANLPSTKSIELGHRLDALPESTRDQIANIINQALEANQDVHHGEAAE